ncbi:MAG: radical SAM protein [Clostridia bacterium]|nr:radical SAM protein [Clostridia bacterium]
MIKLSAGTAHVLGFKKLTTDAPPTTAYLMKGEKCLQECGFCPQARSASSRADLMSRITWAEVNEENIVEAVGTAYNQGRLKRACLQVVAGDRILEEVKETVSKIKGHSNIPVCVSAKVKTTEELLALASTGVERISLALDAACERVFKATKTGSWEETLGQIQEAARLLPGRISTHLIVGLGETEEEMVFMLQMMQDLQVTVGLFAFTPVPGTRMAEVKPPALENYRRIQAAHYLIGNGLIKAADCTFFRGRLISYGLPVEQLRAYLQDGKAFQTSGCPDCNRPYYNEKPGGIIYNYPRPLKPEETRSAVDPVIQSLTENGVARHG